MSKKGKRNLVVVILMVLILLIVVLLGQNYFNKSSKTLGESINSNNEKKTSGDIYVFSHNNEIKVYIKGSKEDSDRYVGYTIKHLKKSLEKGSASSNYDVWSIDQASDYSRNGNKFIKNFPITHKGEWELAIKERGANDYVGGIAHGDEITLDAKSYVDGKQIKVDDFINEEVSEFKLFTKSELFSDTTTDVAPERIGIHEKTYIFDKKGLKLEQKVTFEKNLLLDRSYLTMLPIKRQHEDVLITDTYVIDGDEFDVSDESKIEMLDHDAHKTVITGRDSGINATVEILDKESDIDTKFYVSNAKQYNKLYFSYVDNGYSTSSGEVWKQDSLYKIDTTN